MAATAVAASTSREFAGAGCGVSTSPIREGAGAAGACTYGEITGRRR